MMQWFTQYTERSWKWFQERAHSKHAEVWLGILSFSESSFFLIPPDVLLIAMLAAGAERWVRYALLTSGASVLGALFGYAIGLWLFEPIAAPLISVYHLADEFAYVGALYTDSVFWVVLTAAFTPIPFKVFVLSAGFFAVPFTPFLFAAVLGRSSRFFLVAFLAHRYGPRAAQIFIAHFKKVTLVCVIVLLVIACIHYDVFSFAF